MGLKWLAAEYRKSAAKLLERIFELRQQLMICASPELTLKLQIRITELEYIMSEVTGTARYLEEYYDETEGRENSAAKGNYHGKAELRKAVS